MGVFLFSEAPGNIDGDIDLMVAQRGAEPDDEVDLAAADESNGVNSGNHIRQNTACNIMFFIILLVVNTWQ